MICAKATNTSCTIKCDYVYCCILWQHNTKLLFYQTIIQSFFTVAVIFYIAGCSMLFFSTIENIVSRQLWMRKQLYITCIVLLQRSLSVCANSYVSQDFCVAELMINSITTDFMWKDNTTWQYNVIHGPIATKQPRSKCR